MIKDNTVIALIPARGGSKSIPYKNIKNLCGKPLIAWTIELAKQIKEIDRVIVSTDDEKIEKVALEYGAEVMKRPKELAKDNSLVIDAVRDFIKKLKLAGNRVDIILLLEPTSPLRSKEDIVNALELLVNSNENFDSVATFTEASLNPHRSWRIIDGKPELFIRDAIPWLPRQKLPKAYMLNGAVYAFKTDKLTEKDISCVIGKTGSIIMPRERSIDIDDELDFIIAEELIRRKKDDNS